MGRTACAEEVARVKVIATVLQCICEALPAEVAAEVNAGIRRAYDDTTSPVPESEDAAQARELAPLLAALLRQTHERHLVVRATGNLEGR